MKLICNICGRRFENETHRNVCFELSCVWEYGSLQEFWNNDRKPIKINIFLENASDCPICGKCIEHITESANMNEQIRCPYCGAEIMLIGVL